MGTRFTAARRPVSAWKLWLRYGKPPAGRVFVDAGARTALLSRGASLLPVGVKRVEGNFRAGDAVRVCTLEGEVFATYLEGLSEAFLAEPVAMPPGVTPSTKSRNCLVLPTRLSGCSRWRARSSNPARITRSRLLPLYRWPFRGS